jgi:hypothetical protein
MSTKVTPATHQLEASCSFPRAPSGWSALGVEPGRVRGNRGLDHCAQCRRRTAALPMGCRPMLMRPPLRLRGYLFHAGERVVYCVLGGLEPSAIAAINVCGRRARYLHRFACVDPYNDCGCPHVTCLARVDGPVVVVICGSFHPLSEGQVIGISAGAKIRTACIGC